MKRILAIVFIGIALFSCGAPPPTQHRMPLTSQGCDNLFPSSSRHPNVPPEAIAALESDGVESVTCIVQVSVGVDGRVTSAVVLESTGYPALDSAAIDAASGTKFRPAVENGEVVECETEISYSFGDHG